ncbi:probable E3 ubiquitin-protein ligase makorin-1 [Ptychodera flava]|uniref:probable E3 ubiquitin-protein ligase makorin-1 n=1 Tax=Ptychodera flava TaxID=63121 RepID=UPI003969BFEB
MAEGHRMHAPSTRFTPDPRHQDSYWTKRVLCRYFMNGMCREGVNCRYSHDLSAKPAMTCKYYLKGQCAYGDRCRYDHVKPTPKPTSHIAPKPMGTLPKEDHSSSMVTLKKKGTEDPDSNSLSESLKGKGLNLADFVNVAEFVPGQPYKGSIPSSYSAAIAGEQKSDEKTQKKDKEEQLLCPYAIFGTCRYGDNCKYLHGNTCDMCGKACLHPDDPDQNEKHKLECIAEHERNMEISFAVQHSKEKTCGICMEVILEKTDPKERKFGILSECSHAYCLSCIRKWRSAKQFERKIVRACPECRIPSNFVTPSDYWVDDKEEKQKLIEGYKSVLSTKPCKYFDQGRGACPFGGSCFYLHLYPDGTKEEPKLRRYENADGEKRIMDTIRLWDFFEERETLTWDWDSDDDNMLFLFYDDFDSDFDDFLDDDDIDLSDDDFW